MILDRIDGDRLSFGKISGSLKSSANPRIRLFGGFATINNTFDATMHQMGGVVSQCVFCEFLQIIDTMQLKTYRRMNKTRVVSSVQVVRTPRTRRVEKRQYSRWGNRVTAYRWQMRPINTQDTRKRRCCHGFYLLFCGVKKQRIN
jgi:hypothetical protein